MATEDFSWKEASPGQWSRLMDVPEQLYRMAGTLSRNPKYSHWVLSACVKLPAGKEYTPEDIKSAWKELRYDHPSIACTNDGTNMYYQIPTATDIEEWLSETATIDTSGRSGREVSAAVQPSKRATVSYLPHSRELLIQQHHDRLDGVGSMMLLNRLVKILNRGVNPDIQFGNEHARLTPSLIQVAAQGSLSEELIEEAKEIADKLTEHPPISLGTKVHSDLPEASSSFDLNFTEAETIALIKAAKAKNITLTHATHAAIAQAIMQFANLESGHFVGSCNISKRDALPPPYNGPDYPAGPYLTSRMVSIPISSTTAFDSLATEFKNNYVTWKARPNNVVMLGPIYKGIAAKMQKLKSGAAETVSMSSLGIVERYISEPIDDFWLHLSICVPSAIVYVQTLHGQLRLTICYNSAYHEPEKIERYLGLVKQILVEGLGA